jgi:hypothetical protein
MPFHSAEEGPIFGILVAVTRFLSAVGLEI